MRFRRNHNVKHEEKQSVFLVSAYEFGQRSVPAIRLRSSSYGGLSAQSRRSLGQGGKPGTNIPKTLAYDLRGFADPRAFTRFARRDVLRAAVFQCSVPRLAPRARAASASRKAFAAAAASLPAIACSTALVNLWMIERRARLTVLRRRLCRALFSADACVAITSVP